MDIKKGIYKHYKTGEYRVLGLCRIEATNEEAVMYESLYAAHDFPAGTIWVRPVTSFLETVVVDGQTIPRFTYVGV